MGFSIAYTDVLLPTTLLRTLSLLCFIRHLILVLFHFLGLSHFFDPDPVWQVEYPPASAVLTRGFLPLLKFQHLADPPETCAVCLHEFESEDEIRCLRNCTHVFHRACLDRWMDQEQATCPLCRTSFLPADNPDQRIFATAVVDDLYSPVLEL